MVRIEQLHISNAELSSLALALARRFVQRWDLHARQLDDGRYVCFHKPLHENHLFAHLKGQITLGTYVLTPQSKARFIILDADNEQNYLELIKLAKSLAFDNVPTYVERSRRGGHLWLFFAQWMSGRVAREFGQGLLTAFSIPNVELFPKQDRLSQGPGSLIRMPFGIHQLSGRRYGFYTPYGDPLAPTIREQIQVLSKLQTVPKDALESFRLLAPSATVETVFEVTELPTDTISEQIKASVSVLEFVSQYVDLKPTGSGAIGLCPFHDDHQPSLGINDRENYWHCFAGCGGGSIIDFWIKWSGDDFKSVVAELSQIVL